MIAAALARFAQRTRIRAPPKTLHELVNRPVPLRTGIGSAHDQVSTSSKRAQAFYDQGLAYLHSFVWLEAARSFNEALRADPKLAMAHLGLTIAYTELNAPTRPEAALERAKALAPAASDHDRRHIAARTLQMDAEAGPGGLTRLADYRTALDEALAAYPQDEELWLLRGLAESPDPANRGQGSVAGSIRFYDKALALAPGHFAAHHYLTHAYENSGRIAQALAEGATYAKMAPAVPHARHMHGHNLRRAGRIAEAIDEFRAADALETEYFRTESVPVEYDWHYQHNLDLLATSYQYVGQMAKAEALFKTVVCDPVLAGRAGVQQARVAGVSARPGAREGGARRGARARRPPVAGRERDRAHRGRPRAARAGAVQGGRRRSERGAAADAGAPEGAGLAADAAEGAAGRVLPAHRASRSRGARCSKRWRARSARRRAPTRGRRRSSRSRRSRAPRARSATGTSPPGPHVR